MRVKVPLTKDVWVTLGTAEMIIEVDTVGAKGVCFLSNTGQNENAPLTIRQGSAGWQFSNTKATETIDAMATDDGWALVVDI